ncbi:MAG TPA: hypothetical protein VE912_21725 [Bacteroidales bacterium]|nr:hypothetical protein [Bacteroidales bacterium]
MDDILLCQKLIKNKQPIANKTITLLPGFNTAGYNFEATVDPDASQDEATLLSANDYYPGGMVMSGRSFISGSRYRFGYQGQFAEKDWLLQTEVLRISKGL